MFDFLAKYKFEISTDWVFAGLTVFIFIVFFVCFIIAGVYRNSSPARMFMWIKAIGAGTFFSYGNICLQAHGAEIYMKEFLGLQGLAVWIQPIVFGLFVCLESHWFCLFHVKTAVANMRDNAQYSPLLHDGSEHSDDGVQLVMGNTSHTFDDDDLRDDDLIFEEDSSRDTSVNESRISDHSSLPDADEESAVAPPTDPRRVRMPDPHVLDQIRERNAEEAGFPLFPCLCLACLEGFAVGFELGDINRGKPQFAWKYLHLLFNKAMLALSWGALLQSRLGERKEYLTFVSMLLLAAATPTGILCGQIWHHVDASVLREPMLLDAVFCASSGMYLYLACFPLGDDWRARKITGVLAAVLVAVLANSYVDVLRPEMLEEIQTDEVSEMF